MADETCFVEAVMLEEQLEVFGESSVIMDGVVRGVAVVPCIDGIDGPLQVADEDSIQVGQ